MAEDKGKVTLGVTAAGAKRLEALVNTGWFPSEMAAYRLAISTAVAHELAVSLTPLQGVTTKWNVGSLDRDGSVRELLRLMGPRDLQDPYEYAERLAEAGLRFLKRKIVDQEQLLSEVLAADSPQLTDTEPEATEG